MKLFVDIDVQIDRCTDSYTHISAISDRLFVDLFARPDRTLQDVIDKLLPQMREGSTALAVNGLAWTVVSRALYLVRNRGGA